MLSLRRIATLTMGLLATGSSAFGQLGGPTELDPGLGEKLTWSSPEPFLNVYRVSLAPDLSGAYTTPPMNGVFQGNLFESNLSFRMAWSLGVPTFYFQAVSLNLNTFQTQVSNVLDLDVAQGNRVYHSTTGNGMFVMEMEAEKQVGFWIEETSQAGYTGFGYHVWRGSDHFNDNSHGRKTFRFRVDTPGNYQLALRSWHTGGSDNNDVWVKIDNSSWTKIYAWASESGQWSWTCFTDPGHVRYVKNLSAGVHTFHFAARSRNFYIDRLHLFHTSNYSRGQAENTSLVPGDHHYQ